MNTVVLLLAAISLSEMRASYPNADAVTLEEVERVAYAPDGTYTSESESRTLILTEKGRRQESSLSIGYSKRYGEAAIAYVGIADTNGVERAVDVSATMKEATDNGAMGMNIYDPLDRTITCTVPGLAVGDTLVVRRTRRAFKSRVENQWSDLSVMEWTRPILKSVYEVTAPAARPIRAKAIRHPLGNVVEETRALADGSTLHVFTSTNSPQAFPEPDMPPLYAELQNVRLSTASDWREISSWYWKLCEPHLAKTNAAMVAKARELANLTNIFRFVSQEIRYMGLTMEDTSPGYAPHDVDITFDNRYGVCRDKAGLLVAMLRLAGYKAFPVLINVGAKMDPDVPQPYFNHAIVAVESPDGDYVLMDPTNENTKDLFPAYLCNLSYLVARPEGEGLRTSSVPPPEGNSIDVVSRGRLDRDGAVVLENDISFTGINDTAYRGGLARRTEEDRIKFFEQRLKNAASGAELVTCGIEPKDVRDTSKPLHVKLVAKIPEVLLRGETVDELGVPLVSKCLGLVNMILAGDTALEERKYPLVLDTTARVRETLDLEFGDILGEPLYLPRDERFDDGLAYSRAISVSNGTLHAERALTLGAVEFSSEEYRTLRERLKVVEAAERRRPQFARNRLADADVRYLLNATEVTTFSDRDWVETNTVEKVVLTYNGKKNSAELKIGYNPTWQHVEIVSATVSNRDGRVVSVSEKELNTMDCGWASRAPRYPASRTLVVSLPAVEIGSVIRYTVVTSVTNAPAAFYGRYCFDSYEPTDRRLVRVDDYCRDETDVKRLPDEPCQPDSRLWREYQTISRGRFAPIDLKVGKAELPDGVEPTVEGIRNWMARHVRVTGPSLYEVRLEDQLTDLAAVLAERYATRLDYIRTMAALLRRAGYRADVVLTASNSGTPRFLRREDRETFPDVRAYCLALCRVRLREGGFLGLGGTCRTLFIGTENEYTPLGTTAYDGDDFFDPATGEFGVVSVAEECFKDASEERIVCSVRETGEVDFDCETRTFGSGVGGFRKNFSEILPEDRSRFYQSLLGGVAQAASATRELETDVVSYPSSLRFSCYVPQYATVSDETLSIRLPGFDSPFPVLTGGIRRSPICVGASGERKVESVTVRFPKGWAVIDHQPEAVEFRNPSDPRELWASVAVSSEIDDEGRLIVTVNHRTFPRAETTVLDPAQAQLIREWQRIATARANHTITVRKGESK